MFELEETAASPEQNTNNMQQEAEQQQVMNSHPPQMKLIKLSTNGTHQLQPQECPVQVVQQSLQYPTYLAPVYNPPGQIIMHKNVAFHPPNVNQPIQIITEGKAFQPQIPQVLLQGKPFVHGFTRYATIPTPIYNQTVMISPIEAAASILPASLEQQKEPQDLSRIIITKNRPDAALMMTGWDQSRMLTPQPQTIAKPEIMGPQIMSPMQCYEMHQKPIFHSPSSESSDEWRMRSATNEDLTWLPGSLPDSCLQNQESQNSNSSSEPNDLPETLNSNNKRKNRDKKENSKQNSKNKVKVTKSYRDIHIVRRGKPKYTYSRFFSKNANTACAEVTSTMDETEYDNENETESYSADYALQRLITPIVEINEPEIDSSTIMCNEADVIFAEKSPMLDFRSNESEANQSFSIRKPLREIEENDLKPEELENECEQPSLQFRSEETQTSDLWKEDSCSSPYDEPSGEAESPEIKEETSLDRDEIDDFVDKMTFKKVLIQRQAPLPYTIERSLMQEPSGSLTPSEECKHSGANQKHLQQRDKDIKLSYKKTLIDPIKGTCGRKAEKVSPLQDDDESMISDEEKFTETENEYTSDVEKKSLTKKNEKVECRQVVQDERGRVDPTNWTVNEVCDFIRTLPSCSRYAENFALHDVDGRALLLLDTNHLMTMMSMKLGPAVKLMAKIKAMQVPNNNHNE